MSNFKACPKCDMQNLVNAIQCIKCKHQFNEPELKTVEPAPNAFNNPTINNNPTPNSNNQNVNVNINMANPPYAGNSNSVTKSKVAAGLLAFFLGGLGIHKFYLGYSTAGLIMLLTTIFLGWILGAFTWGIPSLVMSFIAGFEAVTYFCKSDEAFHNTYVANKREWF